MRPITLVVKPVSTACNIRCDYCYHDWNREGYSDDVKMTPDVLEKLMVACKDLNQQTIKFIWHGGEPLLMGLEFYKSALNLQNTLLPQDFKIRNSIQTNGVLLNDSWAEFLVRNKFRVGISLDGPRRIHDKHRVDARERGTFKFVVNAIDRLKKHDCEVGVISVVTKDSIGNEKEIFDFLYSNELYKMNFSPLVDESTIVSSLLPEDFANFMIRIFDLWFGKNDERVKIQLLDSFLQGLIGGKATVCWCQEDCSNFLSVNFNGDVYFCGRFMGFEEFKLGNITKDSLGVILNSQKYCDLKKVLLPRNETCKSCRWLSICNGGCAFHGYDMTQKKFSRHYFCEATQKILTHMEKVVKEMI